LGSADKEVVNKNIDCGSQADDDGGGGAGGGGSQSKGMGNGGVEGSARC
jgi:hypothetical protein